MEAARTTTGHSVLVGEPTPDPLPDAQTSAGDLTSMTGSAAAAAPSKARPGANVVAGYRPRILARCVEMHMDFYEREYGWGIEFEVRQASSLGDLLSRLHASPRHGAWSAVIGGGPGGSPERIVGTIFIDGGRDGQLEEKKARLRMYIVDESARGLGLGKRLLAEAMAFLREKEFVECRLHTLKGLVVARSLYERQGFQVVSEELSGRYGRDTMVVEYLWRRDETQEREG